MNAVPIPETGELHSHQRFQGRDAKAFLRTGRVFRESRDGISVFFGNLLLFKNQMNAATDTRLFAVKKHRYAEDFAESKSGLFQRCSSPWQIAAADDKVQVPSGSNRFWIHLRDPGSHSHPANHFIRHCVPLQRRGYPKNALRNGFHGFLKAPEGSE